MVSGRRETVGQVGRHLEVVAGHASRKPVASVALWPWVELARRHDLALERFARLAGVEVTELRNPDAWFSQVTANRMAELVFQHVGSHAAVEAAQLVEPGQFALFEVLARTAPTVGDALVKGSRFWQLLHTDVLMDDEVLDDASHVMRLTAPPGYPVHHGYFELAFGAWLVALRRESERPDIEPVEVWLRHRPPSDRRPFDQLFGAGLRFEMPEYRLSFARDVVSLPLARKNSAVHAAAVRAAVELVRHRQS